MVGWGEQTLLQSFLFAVWCYIHIDIVQHTTAQCTIQELFSFKINNNTISWSNTNCSLNADIRLISNFIISGNHDLCFTIYAVLLATARNKVKWSNRWWKNLVSTLFKVSVPFSKFYDEQAICKVARTT